MPIDVLAKITHGYYQLTTAEKKVADYVLLHTWETQYMSISELDIYWVSQVWSKT